MYHGVGYRDGRDAAYAAFSDAQPGHRPQNGLRCSHLRTTSDPLHTFQIHEVASRKNDRTGYYRRRDRVYNWVPARETRRYGIATPTAGPGQCELLTRAT